MNFRADGLNFYNTVTAQYTSRINMIETFQKVNILMKQFFFVLPLIEI